MRLYEITQNLNALLALLDQTEDDTWSGFVAGDKTTEPDDLAITELTTAQLAAIGAEVDQLEGDLAGKLEQIIALIKTWEAEESVLRAESRRLAARARTRANRCEYLKNYAQTCMEAAGLGKLKLALWTARLRVSKRVEIDDLTKLPAEYVRVEPKPLKAEMAAAFKAGESIPGASWQEHTSFSAS